MNLDVSSTTLNSHICFNALATLHYIDDVEISCNFCSSTAHTTHVCPVLAQGVHIKDTATGNLSRSSVPHGLQVYEDAHGTHIVSLQKFARGCRFGPFVAPRSYIPVQPAPFPLIVFGAPAVNLDTMHLPELQELFKVRHVHLDTGHEAKCNWMVHVEPASCTNEQNLIAYEEDTHIYYAAIEDLDVGDILKVWYSPVYGERMQKPALQHSAATAVVKNVFASGILSSDYNLLNDFAISAQNPPRPSEILLPSIQTIMKPAACFQYDARPIIRSDAYRSTGVTLTSATISTPAAEPTPIEPSQSTTCLNLDETRASGSPLSDSLSCDSSDDLLERPKAPVSDVSISCSADSPGTDAKDDKRSFPCLLCDKKYSTMTNIYRHVRAQHQCYLCSLCMHIFKCEELLKQHITICPKSNAKKPQCIVCMQYFSNSWSLTRHIKIHISAGECPNVLVDRKPAKEMKKFKPKTKDPPSDIETSSVADSPSLLVNSFDSADVYVGDVSDMISPVELSDTNGSTANGAEADADCTFVRNGAADSAKSDGPSPCIVCKKIFKSKSCLNKHLRNVHTVRVLSSVKRTLSNERGVKTYTKRVHYNESQSSLTHVGAPVNPMTAKALATKLNERHNLLHRMENRAEPVTSNTTRSDSMKSGGPTNPAPVKIRPHPVSPAASISKTENGTSQKVNAVSSTVAPLKIFRCVVCPKTFNKKCELNRHKMTHETFIYVCAYCRKVVKRKQSIVKHLGITHPEKRHIWDTPMFVASLKQCTKPTAAAQPDAYATAMAKQKTRTNVNNNVSLVSYVGVPAGMQGQQIKLERCYDDEPADESVELIDVDGDTQFAPYHLNGSVAAAGEYTEPNHRDNETEPSFAMDMAPTQPSLDHMIDDYFLVDDPLNCTAVLSPFDRDGDEFKMTVDEDNKAMINTDLLNKFHVRLEEMEEKTENPEMWNYMLDDDHLTDDVSANCTAIDAIDENSANFDFCSGHFTTVK